MTAWWLSSEAMTVGVWCEEGVVTEAPPIVRRFIGQPVENLRRWMGRQEGYMEVRL